MIKHSLIVLVLQACTGVFAGPAPCRNDPCYKAVKGSSPNDKSVRKADCKAVFKDLAKVSITETKVVKVTITETLATTQVAASNTFYVTQTETVIRAVPEGSNPAQRKRRAPVEIEDEIQLEARADVSTHQGDRTK